MKEKLKGKISKYKIIIGIVFIIIFIVLLLLIMSPNNKIIQKIFNINYQELGEQELITIDVEKKNKEGNTFYMLAKFISNDTTNKIKKIQCIEENNDITIGKDGKSIIAVDFTVTTENKLKTYRVTTSKGNVIEKQIGIVPVESITLNYDSISLGVIGSKQLKVTVLPQNSDSDVEWISEDTNIATVSNTGLVTRVNTGETNIICRALDGSNMQAVCFAKMTDANAIYTKADLAAIGNNLKGEYILMDDIDCTNSWTPIGDGNNYTFRGKLDGNGHKIYNINAPIFFTINYESEIKNLKIEASIDADDVRQGALAKYAYQRDSKGATVTCVGVTGYVKGNSLVAGLVGNGYAGKDCTLVKDCYVRADITCKTSDYDGAGFIAGNGIGGSGIMPTCINCYFIGTINGATKRIGPIINAGNENQLSNSNITNCFYNTDKYTLPVPSNGGTGINTSQFANKQTFIDAGWDFTRTWIMTEDGYPELRVLLDEDEITRLESLDINN